MSRVAIIGAGMAGLTLANDLREYADVEVFDKAHGPGGRMATRYADPWRFDHGAQFFVARSQAFREVIQPLYSAGEIKSWQARFRELNGDNPAIRWWDDEYPHYVGVPGMNVIGQALARDLNLSLETRIATIEGEPGQWHLGTDNQPVPGKFDWVIVAAPVEQARELLPARFEHHSELSGITMKGCYALMLGFEDELKRDYDVALVRNADISWVAVNSSKPERGPATTVLVHASNAWADAHMDWPLSDVKEHMIEQLIKHTGWPLPDIHFQTVHRWRYANIDQQSGPDSYLDPVSRLGACGDWCIRGRIEAAFTSARALSGELRRQLS